MPKGVGNLEEAMYLMLKGKPRVLEINNRDKAANKQAINGGYINRARILTRLMATA
jgi:hypothetical protein|tara:strand:+ start:5046 stop:5213 length:168 start_codon:yes stop_codon:yes gene_type:complete